VRTYYSNRIFMGFCCINCEVLYLSLFLLRLPAFQAPLFSLPPLLPEATLKGLQPQLGECVHAPW
jgi:CDP-diacylglycerol--inositol 3-phosphatidyltransferase